MTFEYVSNIEEVLECAFNGSINPLKQQQRKLTELSKL
jgi:hypothetical protein